MNQTRDNYRRTPSQANPVPIVNNWEKRSVDGRWIDRPLLPAVSGFQEIQNGAAGVLLIRRSVLVRIDVSMVPRAAG
jgi:hypothetical protein